MTGKAEDRRKKKTQSTKEATVLSLQDLTKAVNERIFRRPLIHKVVMDQKQLDGT